LSAGNVFQAQGSFSNYQTQGRGYIVDENTYSALFVTGTGIFNTVSQQVLIASLTFSTPSISYK
jgi:lipocalin